MRQTRHHRYPKQRKLHKSKKKHYLLILLLFIIPLFIIFIPGPNGLINVLAKSYRKHQLQKEIEYYKIKAELLESKIAKAHNPEYVKKYLMDYYKMVPKDSAK
ncbi:MAG: hypothetical protein N2201_03195 [candidate division WOR-3 bacterium]|nr:hypothetical protein [candidate division WOR-3 bacterium]